MNTHRHLHKKYLSALALLGSLAMVNISATSVDISLTKTFNITIAGDQNVSIPNIDLNADSPVNYIVAAALSTAEERQSLKNDTKLLEDKVKKGFDDVYFISKPIITTHQIDIVVPLRSIDEFNKNNNKISVTIAKKKKKKKKQKNDKTLPFKVYSRNGKEETYMGTFHCYENRKINQLSKGGIRLEKYLEKKLNTSKLHFFLRIGSSNNNKIYIIKGSNDQGTTAKISEAIKAYQIENSYFYYIFGIPSTILSPLPGLSVVIVKDQEQVSYKYKEKTVNKYDDDNDNRQITIIVRTELSAEYQNPLTEVKTPSLVKTKAGIWSIIILIGSAAVSMYKFVPKSRRYFPGFIRKMASKKGKESAE